MGIPASPGRFLRHLRLPMQMVLAPIFALGYALGGGPPNREFALLFLALHVGLYGGATAYNSYCDQDQGPIGGMKHPPVAGAWERWGGLGLQGVAVLVLWTRAGGLGLAALAMLVMGLAYSHPAVRLKARPWASLWLVALGQGLLPFGMGWWAAAATWPPAWAALAAPALVAGLYPLTQVYQIAEDGRRGDCTFAVRHGPAGAFAAARLGTGAGLVLLAVALWRLGRPLWWLGLLALGYALFALVLHQWQRRFGAQDTYQNHDWSFALCAGLALGFWGLIALEMAH